ncbi:MAG: hypothetical protein M1833_006429 [Piccolia ochrophora]|nr:MAG: hypothetical protein M1833_006429 [Piccolia ochrophora]
MPTPPQQLAPRSQLKRRTKSYSVVAVDGGSGGSPTPPPVTEVRTVTHTPSNANGATKTIISVKTISSQPTTTQIVTSSEVERIPEATASVVVTEAHVEVSSPATESSPESAEQSKVGLKSMPSREGNDDAAKEVSHGKPAAPEESTECSTISTPLTSATSTAESSSTTPTSTSTSSSTSTPSYDDGSWHTSYPLWNSTAEGYRPTGSGAPALPRIMARETSVTYALGKD